MASEPSILVPLDGSDLAERAVPVACHLAQRSGATVRLAHVHQPLAADAIHVEGLPLLDEQMRPLRREHEREYLRRTGERLARGVTPRLDLLEGPPAATLAAHAEAVGAGLIVMTSHGRGGLERLWLGSVADELLGCSRVPLLLLRPEQEEAAAPPPAFRRILAPLDGSDLSEAILPHASRLARLLPATELILLRVAPPAAQGSWAGAPEGAGGQAEDAAEYLDRIARRLESEGVRATARVRVDARVAPAILAAAREEQADLLAVATHGRSGPARMVLGSVADKLVRGSDLPLLIHRPPAAR